MCACVSRLTRRSITCVPIVCDFCSPLRRNFRVRNANADECEWQKQARKWQKFAFSFVSISFRWKGIAKLIMNAILRSTPTPSSLWRVRNAFPHNISFLWWKHLGMTQFNGTTMSIRCSICNVCQQIPMNRELRFILDGSASKNNKISFLFISTQCYSAAQYRMHFYWRRWFIFT